MHNDSYLTNPSTVNILKRLVLGETPDRSEVNSVFKDQNAGERFELGRKYGQILTDTDGPLKRTLERVSNGEKLNEKDVAEINRLTEEYATKLGLKGAEKDAFKAGIADHIVFDRRIGEINAVVDIENEIAIGATSTSLPFVKFPFPQSFLNRFGFGTSKNAYLVQQETRIGSQATNQVNNVDDLIQASGNLTKVNSGMQGFYKGDGPTIFKSITQGSVGTSKNGGIIMPDGSIVFQHFSTKTGVYTIDINKAGEIFKIRIVP